MAERTETAVLKEYFGLKDGQTLSEFAAEVKQLSTESKHEMAVAAAEQLGHTLKQV